MTLSWPWYFYFSELWETTLKETPHTIYYATMSPFQHPNLSTFAYSGLLSHFGTIHCQSPSVVLSTNWNQLDVNWTYFFWNFCGSFYDIFPFSIPLKLFFRITITSLKMSRFIWLFYFWCYCKWQIRLRRYCEDCTVGI